MSLTTVSSSLLSIGPKCWSEGPDRLYARSNILYQILSLFSLSKKVTVNRKTQEIHIQGRRLWLWNWQRRIAFQDIQRITYDYTDLIGFIGDGSNSIDKFCIGFELHSRENVHLFSWVGDGSSETGWEGVLLDGDDFVNHVGTQDLDSRNFINQLRTLTGKKLI